MSSSTTKTFHVGISGSYGGLNLGDEAILQSIIMQLRRSLRVEITVFSRDAEDTRLRHKVERVVPVRELTRDEVLPEIEQLDLFILGGGGILYDAEAKTYLREVELAQEKGVPVITYAIGAGPLDDPSTQTIVSDALNNAAVVTVRGRSDKKVLEEIGVHREVIVTADPTWLLEPESIPQSALRREHIDTKHRLVGISVREPGVAAPDIDPDFYHGLLANATDFMIERFDANVVFVPMEGLKLDVQHSHAVLAKMLHPQQAWVLKGTYTSGQLLKLIERFDFAVGMRLHFLIFAALQGVPFVALPYSEKVGGLLDDLCVAMPPMELVNAGRLLAHIDLSWDKRGSLRRRIERFLPRLKERALVNNTIVVDLLKKES